MNIIGLRKIWLSISGLLVLISLAAFLFLGLNLGIDFTGGSLLEVEFGQGRPTNLEIQQKLTELDLGSVNVQPVDAQTVILRFKNIDEQTHQKVLDVFNKEFGAGEAEAEEGDKADGAGAVSSDAESKPSLTVQPIGGPAGLTVEAVTSGAAVTVDSKPEKDDRSVKELRFESIGPILGRELKQKAFLAIIFVLALIIAYVAWAFRRVSWPVKSWKYGLIAVIALVHDVLGVIGLFAILGYFLGTEVNAPFVAALLTVLGYSVNDTIVVFDRVRENLGRHELTFSEVVNNSVNQTFSRSINTTLTTLVVLAAVYLFGGATIKDFSLALIWGIFLGGYSSIFVASPLLVVWYNWDRRKRA